MRNTGTVFRLQQQPPDGISRYPFSLLFEHYGDPFSGAYKTAESHTLFRPEANFELVAQLPDTRAIGNV
tara:strand:- start:349 stop:555 length:207 start_codon:yes stop_codon:yes gene_type:complete